MPTIQTEIRVEASTEVIIKDLDMDEELREAATVCIDSYQQRLPSLHNQHVKPRMFIVKELVLRRVFKNTSNPTIGRF